MESRSGLSNTLHVVNVAACHYINHLSVLQRTLYVDTTPSKDITLLHVGTYMAAVMVHETHVSIQQTVLLEIRTVNIAVSCVIWLMFFFFLKRLDELRY